MPVNAIFPDTIVGGKFYYFCRKRIKLNASLKIKSVN